jgi:hypothetical protein
VGLSDESTVMISSPQRVSRQQEIQSLSRGILVAVSAIAISQSKRSDFESGLDAVQRD